MNLPQFSGEASLGPTMGTYRGNAISGRSNAIGVLPMLGTPCGNCEVIGGLGSIRGVGRRSCCQQVWSCNPMPCHLSQSCWFESCSPDIAESAFTFAP